MFPFLAPIRSANHISQQGTQHYVEITFLADSPYASRAPSTQGSVVAVNAKIPSLRNLDDAETETVSNKSRSSEGLNKLASRPNSRISAAIKKTSVSSLPTSARSEGKSSPVPVKDCVPAPTRHKNKGLEMSSAMMDIFGGGGGSSSFPTPPVAENRDSTSVNRANAGQNLSQPGPEWFEGFDRMDMTGIELPGEKRTPDFDSDWQDAKEDVLQSQESSTLKFSKTFAESLPGPDIGYEETEDEEEVEEEEETIESKAAASAADDNDNEKAEDVGSSPSSSKKGHPSDAARRDSVASGESGEADEQRRENTENEEERRDEQSGSQEESKSAGSGAGGMVVLLVKNARIVNDDAIFVADILVEDGVIRNVAPNIEAPEGVEVIDATDKMVFPAGIDVYTQATESSVDDLSTGCRSAIAGGTATIIEVVRPRNGESLVSAVKRVKAQVENSAQCHVSISVAIADFNESVKSDMSQVVANEGVNSFVLDGARQSDDKLFELLEHASKLGAHVRILPENKSIISILEKKMLKLGVTGPEGYAQSHPETLEADQVNSICVLANLANCPVSIVSVSSAESLSAIEKARGTGALAYAEIAAAAVAGDGSAYLSQDLKVAYAHLTDIPLRKSAADRLLSALSTQPLVVCTSAHKPVNSTARTSAKDFTQAAKGSAGAEQRMAVLWEKAVRSGRIDPMRFVAVTSSNAAKVFNLYPRKGRIAVGADADLVIWDGSGKRVLEAAQTQSQQESTLYDGMTVHSTVFATIVSGKIAFQNGAIGETTGGFLPLSPNSPHLFGMVGMRDKFSNVEKVERGAAQPAQNGHQAAAAALPPKGGEFNRNRQNVMESSIDFGGARANRGRNPPGGKTTGFW